MYTCYLPLQACRALQSSLSPSQSLPENILIFSSDFKRASETAEIIREQFKVKDNVRYDLALRERSFGTLHMMSDTNYEKVWDLDSVQPQHTEYDSESVVSVALRTSRLVHRLEKEFESKTIILVSHGDTLQILSTLFMGLAPNEHRAVPYLAPSQIRELKDNP